MIDKVLDCLPAPARTKLVRLVAVRDKLFGEYGLVADALAAREQRLREMETSLALKRSGQPVVSVSGLVQTTSHPPRDPAVEERLSKQIEVEQAEVSQRRTLVAARQRAYEPVGALTRHLLGFVAAADPNCIVPAEPTEARLR